MTYAYLLVAEWLGGANSQSLRERRAALYAELPAHALSAWIATRDPRFESVLQTNLDLAAAWSARQNAWFFGYLQPHPWQYKDLGCERAAGTKLMVGRLGPTIDEARYADIMRAAFQGYARAYGALDQAYAGEMRIRFIDLRQLFDGLADCIYNDPIHYNDQGNRLIAERMHADLRAGGFIDQP